MARNNSNEQLHTSFYDNYLSPIQATLRLTILSPGIMHLPTLRNHLIHRYSSRRRPSQSTTSRDPAPRGPISNQVRCIPRRKELHAVLGISNRWNVFNNNSGCDKVEKRKEKWSKVTIRTRVESPYIKRI